MTTLFRARRSYTCTQANPCTMPKPRSRVPRPRRHGCRLRAPARLVGRRLRDHRPGQYDTGAITSMPPRCSSATTEARVRSLDPARSKPPTLTPSKSEHRHANGP